MFGHDSTTEDVLAGVDLTGRSYLVTGVSAGLGVETARALVAHGADVVGTARDLAKAQAATASVREAAEAGAGSFHIVALDLASLASVRAGADALLEAGTPFDAVIANAGVMACPPGKTADGFETQFGTNHLGHFVFVNRIAGLIKPGGRMISLSSSAHRRADVNLDDPNFEHTPYEPMESYGRSKTANVLFAVEFDRRHRDRGVRAAAVHPGGIQTELTRHLGDGTLEAFIRKSTPPGGTPTMKIKTIPQGAATTVWATAVAPADAIGGLFCEDCHVAHISATPEVMGGVQAYAIDPERAKALWAKSEELVGERF